MYETNALYLAFTEMKSLSEVQIFLFLVTVLHFSHNEKKRVRTEFVPILSPIIYCSFKVCVWFS